MFKKEIIEKIIKVSNETKTPEKIVCVQYGVKPGSLGYYKRKYGIKTNPIGKAPCTARLKRKKNVNDSFFNKPNILNSYYAGFFFFFFYVGKNKKNCAIMLALKDEKWLEQFSNDLDFSGKLLYGVSKTKFPYVSLTFTSSNIVSDLEINFNIIPQKSLRLTPPNLNNTSYIDAFICGYIDGDGSIGLIKNKKTQDILRISLVGTFDMCAWIQKRFSEIVGVENAGCLIKKGNSENTFTYTVVNKQARIIFEHFYFINVPKLKRKWSETIHTYCVNFKKALPLVRRKGINIFNLNGEFLKRCETLKDAQEYTGVSFTTISKLCKKDDNKHQGNGYMFSRTKQKLGPYLAPKEINKKYIQ